MNVFIYQIIVPFFCVIMIFKTLSHFIRGDRTFRELLAVSVFWWSIASLALYPTIFKEIATLIGFKDYINAILFLCIAILFYIVMHLLAVSDEHQQKLTKIVRKQALKEAKKFNS
ncbi:DUF2304 family protein [Candidatus Dojkabacteria bacterium]|nr:DUF2304 family protein [Candidatus Dojkabacteria bacterium]